MDNYDAIAAEANAEFDQIVSDIKTANKRRILVKRMINVGTVVALAATAAVIVNKKNEK